MNTRDLTPRAVLSNFPLMLILIFAFVNQLAFGLLQATFALYGEDVLFTELDTEDVSLGIGLLLAGIGLGQVITQTAILPRLTKRFRDSILVTIGYCCSSGIDPDLQDRKSKSGDITAIRIKYQLNYSTTKAGHGFLPFFVL